MDEEQAERVDLSSLDPERRSGFDARVRALAAEAMGARRAARVGGVYRGLVKWRRAVLTAAAVIVLCSVPALLFLRPSRPPAPSTVAEALGVPRPLVDWVTSAHQPTPGEVISVLGERSR